MSTFDTVTTDEQAVAPDVFAVDYECNNCGATFDETYAAGTTVEETRSGHKRIVGVNVGHGTERVTCPTCEIDYGIDVTDRYPLDEDESEELRPLENFLDHERDEVVSERCVAYMGFIPGRVFDHIAESDWNVEKVTRVVKEHDELDDDSGVKVTFDIT